MKKHIATEAISYTDQDIRQFSEDKLAYHNYKHKLCWVPFAFLIPLFVIIFGTRYDSILLTLFGIALTIGMMMFSVIFDRKVKTSCSFCGGNMVRHRFHPDPLKERGGGIAYICHSCDTKFVAVSYMGLSDG